MGLILAQILAALRQHNGCTKKHISYEIMHEDVIDEDQLKSWREEQLRIASTVNQPDQCTFAAEQCHDTAFSESAPDDYHDRFRHLGINPGVSSETHPFRIGGVDVSFPKDSADDAIAVYVILEYSDLLSPPKVVYRSHRSYAPPPYVPSYLSFRESPPLLSLISEQLRTHPRLRPHVLMVDGNGRWHERRAGLACFVGRCGIPCIGVGKTWYRCDGRDVDVARAVEMSVVEWHSSFHKRLERDGRLESDECVVFDSVPFTDISRTDLSSKPSDVPTTVERMLSELYSVAYGLAIPMIDDTSAERETLAYALVGHGGRTSSKYATWSTRGTKRKRGSKNPIYISVGDNIALRDAVVLVAYACGVSRIPEPVREADRYGRCLLRDAAKEGRIQE
ncbi:hypothetical protein ACHAW6_010003 [Cyclotella cf. meneghiniana]